MNKVDRLRKEHSEKLKTLCSKHHIGFESLQNLLNAERTKKLLRRNNLIQQNIDKEVNNSIENES
jgi:hypothetical protein